MTKEEQRIKIAEFCGWGNIRYKDGYLVALPHDYMQGWQKVPNYPYSLDAMHEAESAFSYEQHDRFRAELWNITVGKGVSFVSATSEQRRAFVSATAAQRAEAFIQTINPQPEGGGPTVFA